MSEEPPHIHPYIHTSFILYDLKKISERGSCSLQLLISTVDFRQALNGDLAHSLAQDIINRKPADQLFVQFPFLVLQWRRFLRLDVS